MTERAAIVTDIVEAIRGITDGRTAALHEPCFNGNEWTYLKECLDSTFVSSVGAFVNRFEAELAVYTGAGYAIAVMNGTAALHVALQLGGVRDGDEVLVPALTFVATPNAVSYCRAVPHFVDSDENTLGVDPQALRQYLARTTGLVDGACVNRASGRPIRAIVPMHVFGHPVDLDGLLEVAAEFNLVVIEDAAESLGSTYHGRHTGTIGRLGVLSFNGNKTITTGGGGAILTNDAELARRAKHLTTTARVPHRWEYRHDEVGYNYRLPNLNAALGCAQLEQLPTLLQAKRSLYVRYSTAVGGIDGVSLMTEPAGCRSNYWLQALLLDDKWAGQRDAILAATNERGLMTRPVWNLNNSLPAFQNCPHMPLPVATALQKRIINVPSSAQLAMEPPA